MKKTRKTYSPTKYYKGLSATKKIQRKREIAKYGSMSWKNPKAYVGFRTNVGIQPRTSSYTATWRKQFPDATSLEQKSDATGVPLRFLREVYRRGMAAWRTGHRPGATEQQWGYARVHSFLLRGTTYYTTDSDIVKRAKQESEEAKRWWTRLQKN